jgi:hypothetical protein
MTRVLDEKKSQQIQVHPLTPLYTYVTCDDDATILVAIKTNDVLPRVLILNYLNYYYYYYYFEIIYEVQFKCLDDIIL